MFIYDIFITLIRYFKQTIELSFYLSLIVTMFHFNTQHFEFDRLTFLSATALNVRLTSLRMLQQN